MSKRTDWDKEMSVVDKIYKGSELKSVAWDEGLSLKSVYNIKNRYPLFCWRKDDE